MNKTIEQAIGRFLDKFQDFFKTPLDLLKFIKYYPQHRDALIKFVISVPGELARITHTCLDLEILNSFFPEHSDEFANLITNSASQFNRLVTNIVDLTFLLSSFPSHTDALLSSAFRAESLDHFLSLAPNVTLTRNFIIDYLIESLPQYKDIISNKRIELSAKDNTESYPTTSPSYRL